MQSKKPDTVTREFPATSWVNPEAVREKWPRISIVTPSYNQGNYLEETIRSILDQEYPNLEYIVIDGGSDDGAVDIIKQYESRLAYWKSEPDEGQSHAINKGFNRCTGDIITFCNSDDYYLPGTLVDVAKAYQQHPNCGVIVGGFQYVDHRSQPLGDMIPPRLDVSAPYDLTLGPPGVYRLHQAAAFFTRQAMDAVGRYVREDLNYTMDRELLYRVVSHFPVVLRQRLYAAFRLHEDSKSVAHILPFAEEFARLYLMHLSGEKAVDRRRQRMANIHRAKGYLKYAKNVSDPKRKIVALCKALYYRPDFLMQKRYYGRWLPLLDLR